MVVMKVTLLIRVKFNDHHKKILNNNKMFENSIYLKKIPISQMHIIFL